LLKNLLGTLILDPCHSEFAGAISGVAFAVPVSCCISGSQKYPISSKIGLFFSSNHNVAVVSFNKFSVYYLFSFTILILVVSFFILILKIVVAFPVPISQKVAKIPDFIEKYGSFSRQITMSLFLHSIV
jgi:hypothetical protein